MIAKRVLDSFIVYRGFLFWVRSTTIALPMPTFEE
jgi:hypothetical protein